MAIRLWIALLVIAVAAPCRAEEKGIALIGSAIASYRLAGSYCHWPIPANIDQVLSSDQAHFLAKNPKAFNEGVKIGTDRFYFLTKSVPKYCDEVKDSRNEMTKNLASRAH